MDEPEHAIDEDELRRSRAQGEKMLFIAYKKFARDQIKSMNLPLLLRAIAEAVDDEMNGRA